MKHCIKYFSDDQTARLDAFITERSPEMPRLNAARPAEINDIYGYQLFAGSRKPSRDKLIALCIGMSLTLDRTQALLKATGFAPLYAKNKRDSILIFGIQNNQTVLEINTALYDHAEPTL